MAITTEQYARFIHTTCRLTHVTAEQLTEQYQREAAEAARRDVERLRDRAHRAVRAARWATTLERCYAGDGETERAVAYKARAGKCWAIHTALVLQLGSN